MARRITTSIPATTSIRNYWSGGGISTIQSKLYYPLVTSGALGAAEFYTALNVSGSGWAPVLFAYNNSATPTHTIRLQVVVDGITVFDATSDSIATTANVRCVVAAGTINGTGSTNVVSPGEPIRFNASLVVKIASSQAGTDYVGLAYEYHLT